MAKKKSARGRRRDAAAASSAICAKDHRYIRNSVISHGPQIQLRESKEEYRPHLEMKEKKLVVPSVASNQSLRGRFCKIWIEADVLSKKVYKPGTKHEDIIYHFKYPDRDSELVSVTKFPIWQKMLDRGGQGELIGEAGNDPSSAFHAKIARPFNARIVKWDGNKQLYECTMDVMDFYTKKLRVFWYTREDVEQFLLPVDYFDE
ncbi:hypothetical protein B484DRAFT_471618 [Ochromonadaceae sp. CCMP2298]|nr:hypothetical protein B484DRAFT_471618 [Ochromonadaceae sp. CCMP2298]